MRIVILGIFVADTAHRAARLPRMGETVLGRDFLLGPGGKGSNQAVAAARAGGSVGLITRLGRDAFAGMAHEVWATTGVTPLAVEDPQTATGSAFIFVEEGTGANAVLVTPGAAGRISVADVEAEARRIAAARVFLTQLEQPLEPALHGLRLARAAGVRTVLNPAPAMDLPAEALRLSDILTPNETEAELLTGIPVRDPEGARAAASALLARGVGAVVVTLGAQGAFYMDSGRGFHVPPMRAGAVIDTTGAGDAFNGALAAALAEDQPLDRALRFATATAALSVTRPGTAGSMPARDEIETLLTKGPLS